MPFSGIKVQEQSYFYFSTKYLVKSQVNTNLRFFKEQDGKNVKDYSFTMQCHCQKIFIFGVGGFSKILRNFQSGSWQMLTFSYKVGGWAEKMPKTCLRNI